MESFKARCFSGIAGQVVPVQILSHLVGQSKLPGTMLFYGPGGVGKLATALALAKSLHCRENASGMCSCSSCSAIRAGTHPDVIVISREKQIGVEEMRELVSLAALRSASDQQRFIIIDRAENITQGAANAALKTFEEPGERIRFILITDTPHALLPTVRSRAYKLRFSYLSNSQMKDFALMAGYDPSLSDVRDGISHAFRSPGRFLRQSTDGYRNFAAEVRIWISQITDNPGKVTIEHALNWKSTFWDFAERLYKLEREIYIPRGADALEIGWSKLNPSKNRLAPINWNIEETAVKESRWSQSRKAILLAGFIRDVVSDKLIYGGMHLIFHFSDFIQKIQFNCSFDIALERLYFKIAGSCR